MKIRTAGASYRGTDDVQAEKRRGIDYDQAYEKGGSHNKQNSKTARRIKQAEALTGRTDTTRKKPPDLDQAAFYEAGKEWDSDAGLCFVFPKTSASQIQTRITVIK
ncbi:hypothetical protein QNN00_25415 [Bacillus velezensis]|nr:hypothetical protein [Bacillus velezensis]